METQASTARSLTESCMVQFSAFAPENVRGLTFTAPNSETGSNRNQTGKSVQIKCTKTLTALWRKAAWFCGFKLTNTIYKFKQVEK